MRNDTEHAVHEEGQHRDEEATGQNLSAATGDGEAETGVDDVAETAAGHQRRQRRRRDHLHRSRAYASGDVRHRERQLDTTKQLPAGHAHAERGVAYLRVDLAHPGIRIRQDRRDAEDGERRYRGRGTDAGDARDVNHGEQGVRRDRTRRVRERDHEATTVTDVSEPDPEWQPDRARNQYGE